MYDPFGSHENKFLKNLFLKIKEKYILYLIHRRIYSIENESHTFEKMNSFFL